MSGITIFQGPVKGCQCLSTAIRLHVLFIWGLGPCVLVTTSARHAKLGGVPRGMRSVDTLPPTPAAGAPPAGPWQEPNWVCPYVDRLND